VWWALQPSLASLVVLGGTESQHCLDVILADWAAWGACCEEIIRVVEKVLNAVVILQGPLYGFSHQIKEEGG